MKKLKLVAAATVVSALLVAGGVSANAGTAYEAYETTVGRVYGSGYTSYQTKASSQAKAYLVSTNVGSNYSVKARTNGSSGSGSWTGYVVDDNTSHYLSSETPKGNTERVQFRNKLTTYVSVQVTGKWKSN